MKSSYPTLPPPLSPWKYVDNIQLPPGMIEYCKMIAESDPATITRPEDIVVSDDSDDEEEPWSPDRCLKCFKAESRIDGMTICPACTDDCVTCPMCKRKTLYPQSCWECADPGCDGIGVHVLFCSGCHRLFNDGFITDKYPYCSHECFKARQAYSDPTNWLYYGPSLCTVCKHTIENGLVMHSAPFCSGECVAQLWPAQQHYIK